MSTNIGVDPAEIAAAVRDLVADATTWVELRTFEPDELAIRFHQRLVAIHPFPNGNGRHGRNRVGSPGDRTQSEAVHLGRRAPR
ncbi:MAG: Fic family protein [Ilumatobacteraceae bacterium]